MPRSDRRRDCLARFLRERGRRRHYGDLGLGVGVAGRRRCCRFGRRRRCGRLASDDDVLDAVEERGGFLGRDVGRQGLDGIRSHRPDRATPQGWAQTAAGARFGNRIGHRRRLGRGRLRRSRFNRSGLGRRWFGGRRLGQRRQGLADARLNCRVTGVGAEREDVRCCSVGHRLGVGEIAGRGEIQGGLVVAELGVEIVLQLDCRIGGGRLVDRRGLRPVQVPRELAQRVPARQALALRG